MIVADASAVIEVLLNTAAGEDISEALFDSSETVAAPHLLNVEVMQVLRRYSLSGEIGTERGRLAIEDLEDMPIEFYPHDPFLKRIWELRNNVTAYDAVYIALAEALDAMLLTRDERLASAPGHDARIELV